MAHSVHRVSDQTLSFLGVVMMMLGTTQNTLAQEVPVEISRFREHPGNPVFTGAGEGKWDARIRERGWILKRRDQYMLWYTGYDGTREGLKKLGLATSPDGIHWKRHPSNPVYSDHWVEDMMVVERNGTLFMFAEGAGDQAQLLRSNDGIHWHRTGTLDIRLQNGKPIPAGPFGTPTGLFANDRWYLFYERRDAGIWAATSEDMKVWTNISDEPVLQPGPESYDQLMIALNQVIPYRGRYYAVFHGSGTPQKPRFWATGIAVSDDLLHWKKFSGNPLLPIPANRSSGQLVPVNNGFWLYTMHDRVDVHLPAP